jgi:hypothetical protein
MQKVKFFRIHHVTNKAIGCYSGKYSENINRLASCEIFVGDYDKHPLPQADSLLWNKITTYVSDNKSIDFSDYYFGFTSPEQLRAWFYNDDWLEWLHNEGYILTEFECDDTPEIFMAGHTQAIAILDKITEVKQYSLSDL